jgi:riboflavin biosynthesis pyrimidine reductase
MHDGILIGIGTAVNDNPQLNGAYPIVACRTTTRLMIRFDSPTSPISDTKHAFSALPPPASSHS